MATVGNQAVMVMGLVGRLGTQGCSEVLGWVGLSGVKKVCRNARSSPSGNSTGKGPRY